jgi:hypothetical protein
MATVATRNNAMKVGAARVGGIGPSVAMPPLPAPPIQLRPVPTHAAPPNRDIGSCHAVRVRRPSGPRSLASARHGRRPLPPPRQQVLGSSPQSLRGAVGRNNLAPGSHRRNSPPRPNHRAPSPRFMGLCRDPDTCTSKRVVASPTRRVLLSCMLISSTPTTGWLGQQVYRVFPRDTGRAPRRTRGGMG